MPCEIERAKVIILVLSSIKKKTTRNKFYHVPYELARLGGVEVIILVLDF